MTPLKKFTLIALMLNSVALSVAVINSLWTLALLNGLAMAWNFYSITSDPTGEKSA